MSGQSIRYPVKNRPESWWSFAGADEADFEEHAFLWTIIPFLFASALFIVLIIADAIFTGGISEFPIWALKTATFTAWGAVALLYASFALNITWLRLTHGPKIDTEIWNRKQRFLSLPKDIQDRFPRYLELLGEPTPLHKTISELADENYRLMTLGDRNKQAQAVESRRKLLADYTELGNDILIDMRKFNDEMID